MVEYDLSRQATPLVSALVPTYNSAAFVRRTLGSLAKQTWENLEILIGDDCSSDTTKAIVEDFADGHENVRLLPRERNLGWLDNSNDLLANARGDYAFFAFHDDVVEPTFVERLVRALEDSPHTVLAYSDMLVTEVDGNHFTATFPDDDLTDHLLRRATTIGQRPDGWWVPVHGVFRANDSAAIGGFRKSAAGEYSADWRWLLGLSLRGRFVRVPETLYFKYYMGESLSKTWTHGENEAAALQRAAAGAILASRISVGAKAILLVRITLMPQVRWTAKRVARGAKKILLGRVRHRVA